MLAAAAEEMKVETEEGSVTSFEGLPPQGWEEGGGDEKEKRQ